MDTLLLQPFAPLPSSAPLHSCAPLFHDLFEPVCPSNPLPSLEQPTYYSAPTSRKRKSLSDFAGQEPFIDVVCRSGCSTSLTIDNIHTPSFAALPQRACDSADSGQYRGCLDDEDDGQAAAMSATRNCASDLEDILSFLWMEGDTASTAQSATAVATSTNQQASPAEEQQLPLLIADFDWLAPDSYCSDEGTAKRGHEVCNERPSGGELVEAATPPWRKEKCDLLPSVWPKAGGFLQADSSSEAEQSLLHRDTRASWRDEKPKGSWQDAIKSSWEGTEQGRANWQRKHIDGGSSRATWLAEGGHDRRIASGGGGNGGSGGTASSSLAWAGPTLMDIESALALTEQSLSGPSTPSSSSGRHIVASPFIDLKALLAQRDAPQLDSESSSWRQKLQKRNSQEPKYTMKVESEEKALGDGYRWRKYGQKSIKNSPFPRSYYRCSTGKCSAKKQVERSQEEEGVFLVTYEGIHLHHKPIMLHKLRVSVDGTGEEKEKGMPCDTEKSPSSPSSSTSCSRSTASYKT